MKTLVAISHREFAGKRFTHGSEIPPGTLPDEIIDKWVDWRWLREYDESERCSLYRFFPAFSGATEQK